MFSNHRDLSSPSAWLFSDERYFVINVIFALFSPGNTGADFNFSCGFCGTQNGHGKSVEQLPWFAVKKFIAGMVSVVHGIELGTSRHVKGHFAVAVGTTRPLLSTAYTFTYFKSIPLDLKSLFSASNLRQRLYPSFPTDDEPLLFRFYGQWQQFSPLRTAHSATKSYSVF